MLPREDKLADTAPKQPLALTLGAAAVTIAVILGVLAGPSVVTCFNSSDGMGQCLRGKMVGAGILPTPATAVSAPAAAPTEEVAVVAPSAETTVGEPALDVTPPAEAPENLIAATFGLLRAEPDGSVIIAGSGTPGSEVEIYSNDTLLGKATVESSGDWVFVPDAPIAPGGTEITLGEAGKTGRSEQSFVVAINEDKTSEPLVVASTPGAASEVLQGIETPVAEPTQIAAADPVVPPSKPAAVEPTPAAPPAEAAPAAEPDAPASDVATSEAPPTETPAPEPATATETPAIAPAEPTPPLAATAKAEPAIEPTAPAEPASPQPSAEPAAPAEAPTAVAVAEPAVATPPAVVVDPTPPTIDAIEIEGDRTFFAGAGPEGATTRLYVEDQFIAETKVADGRWLVEAGKVLNNPSQRIRIDVLQPDSAKVASRAEVNFVVELPADEAPVAVAQADEPVVAPAEPAAAPTDTAPAPEPVVETAPDVGTPAAPPEPAPAVEPTPPAETAVASEPAPAMEPKPAEPAAATEPAPATETPAPVASDVPTLVAVSVGDPEAARFASGKAIIRRGDNLWTIARRVYGEGIKYTTIYQANTGQIRDPDRIYPGQVFELPEGAN